MSVSQLRSVSTDWQAYGYEKAFIGSVIMMGGRGVDLEPSAFENRTYGEIWRMIRDQADVDMVALQSRFDESMLSELVSSVPTIANLKKCAAKIRGFAHRRKVGDALNRAKIQYDAGEALAVVGETIGLALDDVPSDEGSVSLNDVLIESYRAIETAYKQNSNVNFVPSGFDSIDSRIGGLQKNGLIILAARPSMGKTAMAMNLARNAAFKAPVLICSMEMSRKQLGMRFMAAEANLNLSKMMQGDMAPDEWSRLAETPKQLSDCNLHINSKASRTIQDVSAEARRFKRKHGRIGLLIIDYLGLLEMDGRENKAEKVSQVTRAAKILTGETDLNCPVVLLSQLNRDLEKRADKHPMMADLRDSGSIEQDADQIIFLYRDEVYNDNPKKKGLADVDFAKNRNGPTGVVNMEWIGKSTKFKDLPTFDD